MRFAVPVNDAAEIPALAEAGAGEFYCGYQDARWQSLFGSHDSASRRQGRANLADPDALRAVVAGARARGLPVSLTLNGRVTERQLPELARIAALWADCGGEGIILRDPGLLLMLRAQFDFHYTVSLLTVTVNADGAAFWRDLGAQRLVLPRFLRPAQIAAITAAVPDMEYEAMVMGDLCPFIDGFCRSVHAESFVSAPPRAQESSVRKSCNPSGSAFHLCEDYCAPALDPCAACRLGEMERIGVAVGKLGGRGTPPERRLQWLRFLRKAEMLDDPTACQLLYQRSFHHGCSCYLEEGEGA